MVNKPKTNLCSLRIERILSVDHIVENATERPNVSLWSHLERLIQSLEWKRDHEHNSQIYPYLIALARIEAVLSSHLRSLKRLGSHVGESAHLGILQGNIFFSEDERTNGTRRLTLSHSCILSHLHDGGLRRGNRGGDAEIDELQIAHNKDEVGWLEVGVDDVCKEMNFVNSRLFNYLD